VQSSRLRFRGVLGFAFLRFAAFFCLVLGFVSQISRLHNLSSKLLGFICPGSIVGVNSTGSKLNFPLLGFTCRGKSSRLRFPDVPGFVSPGFQVSFTQVLLASFCRVLGFIYPGSRLPFARF